MHASVADLGSCFRLNLKNGIHSAKYKAKGRLFIYIDSILILLSNDT